MDTPAVVPAIDPARVYQLGEPVKLQLFHPRSGVRVILPGRIAAARTDGQYEIALDPVAEAGDFKALITVPHYEINHTPPPPPGLQFR
jgi:hypothetical protein